jgi:hypothetical protein
MTGLRTVVDVVGEDPVGGGAVGTGVVLAGADPAGTVVGAVGLTGTLVGIGDPVMGEVGPGDATNDVVEVPRLVGGTDVSPSSPDEHAARMIARATAAPAAHRLTLAVAGSLSPA